MAATIQKLQDGDRVAQFRFLNNDTAETAAPVTKVDISDDTEIDPHSRSGLQPTSLRILRMWFSIGQDPVDLFFGATANQLAWSFAGGADGYLDFRCHGGLRPDDVGAAGFTGDLLLQARGTFAAATDGYSIVVEVEKRYD